MSQGADLFVVCKQCGSEVSPYITECPYCGNRLRRRAPKLPRPGDSGRGGKGRRGFGSLLRRDDASGLGTRRSREREAPVFSDRWAVRRPYATIALVGVAFACWVATRAEYSLLGHMAIVGPLHGDWWRLFTYQFAYVEGGGGGVYAFVAITATGLFGWLLERRHGPAVVLALYLGAGALAGLVAEAVYTQHVVAGLALESKPILIGGNAGALALLAAWATPDLQRARHGDADGDLLGAGVIGALLLAIPFARPEAGWLAGVVGAALGFAVGLGLSAFARATR
ncbi:MAG TPA: rhomboid family intramembrane serine protease [Solirubrobacteraceae bacterium]